jgi:hypothetical protein
MKYETGTATFIQFGLVSIFALANQILAIFNSCFGEDAQCVEGVFTAFMFFVLTVMLFMGIWFLGHTAQEKRSKWLSLFLIVVELGVLRIAYHNAKNHTDWLSLAASTVNIVLSVMVIFLAFRLMRSKGGRIVTKQRPRKRKAKSE